VVRILREKISSMLLTNYILEEMALKIEMAEDQMNEIEKQLQPGNIIEEDEVEKLRDNIALLRTYQETSQMLEMVDARYLPDPQLSSKEGDIRFVKAKIRMLRRKIRPSNTLRKLRQLKGFRYVKKEIKLQQQKILGTASLIDRKKGNAAVRKKTQSQFDISIRY